MALQELGTIRGLVRNSINEPVQDKFTNPELNAIISLVQNEVIRRLMRVNTVWFAAQETITGLTPVGGEYCFTLPATCGEIVSAMTAAGVAITIKPLSALPDLTTNPMWLPSTSNPYGIQIGTVLLVYPKTITSIKVNFIKKGVELTNDSDKTIIPFEFIDILVAGTIAKCAEKAGLNAAQKEKEYDEMFPEAEVRKRKDVDEEKSISGERQ